jgi:uncharacterized protein YukE
VLIFDYHKAMAQVRELRQIAGELQSMQNKTLAEAIYSIDASWKGRTGQSFLAKCAELRTRIEKEAIDITKIADSLEANANLIAKEEREAARVLAAKS